MGLTAAVGRFDRLGDQLAGDPDAISAPAAPLRQGLLPRRQPELAKRLGEVVGDQLVTLDELFAPVKGANLRSQYEQLIDAVMDRRLADFLAPDRGAADFGESGRFPRHGGG